MAAPTIVGTGAFAANTGSIVPSLPAGLVDGDWMFLLVSTANQVVATPSGWTIEPPAPLGSGTAGAVGAHRLSLFRKVFVTGDTAPTVADSGSYQAARIFAVRGADSVNAVGSGSDPGGTGTDPAAASITTTVDDCLVLLIGECDRDIQSSNTQFLVSASPNVDGAAMTEIIDDHTSQGAGGGIAVAHATKATAGTISGTTFRFGSNLLPSHHIHMALAPAAGGGPDPVTGTGASTAPGLELAAPLAAGSGAFSVGSVAGTGAALAPALALAAPVAAAAGAFAVGGIAGAGAGIAPALQLATPLASAAGSQSVAAVTGTGAALAPGLALAAPLVSVSASFVAPGVTGVGTAAASPLVLGAPAASAAASFITPGVAGTGAAAAPLLTLATPTAAGAGSFTIAPVSASGAALAPALVLGNPLAAASGTYADFVIGPPDLVFAVRAEPVRFTVPAEPARFVVRREQTTFTVMRKAA